MAKEERWVPDLGKGMQNFENSRSFGGNKQIIRSKLTYDDDAILKEQEKFMKEKYVRQKRTRPPPQPKKQETSETPEPPKFSLGNVIERTTKRRKIQPPKPSNRGFPEVMRRRKNLDRKFNRKKHRSIFAMQMSKGESMDVEKGKQMFEKQKLENDSSNTMDASFISSIKGVSKQEANEIGSKNDELLSGMSEDEILAMRKQLLSSLDPDLLAFVSKQGEEKTEPEVCISAKPAEPEPMEVDPKPSGGLTERGITASIQEKMEWMKPVEKKELQNPVYAELGENPIEVQRFNFKGLMCDPHKDVDVGEGLHHHGEDPVRAGYTIREAFHFSQSTVSSQRILGLNLLTAIAKNAREGTFGEKSNLIFELFAELCVEITIFLAFRNSNRNISLASLRLLHSMLYPKELDLELMDALDSSFFGTQIVSRKPFGFRASDTGSFEKDFLNACVKEQNLLQTLVQIAENNPQAVNLVLDILIAVANHSQDMCSTILECEPLTEYLELSMDSSWKVLRILRICLSSSKEKLSKWAERGFLDSVKQYLLGGDPRLKLEVLYLWRASLDFGVDVDSYVDMFSVLIQTPGNYKKAPLLFTRNVYAIQSTLVRILSNANQSVDGNPHRVKWSHVAKRAEACLGTLTKNRDSKCKTGQDFIGIAGLFHFAADYFITLKDECLDDVDLHTYAKSQSANLVSKWFASDSSLIESLLNVSDDLEESSFDGPLFKHLPNPLLPSRCGHSPSAIRVAQTDALHGLLRFAMALLHFNHEVASMLMNNFLPKLISLLPNLHSNVAQLTPQMQVLKCQLWQNDFSVGFHSLLLWNSLDSSFCTIDPSQSSILFSTVCSLLENSPCGFSDFTSILVHEFLDNEMLLEALYMQASKKLNEDYVAYLAPDLPTIASNLSKVYTSVFKYTINLKECRALHTFNHKDVKSLFMRLKNVNSCWILTPLLQKNPANLQELQTCLHFINLLCLSDVPYAHAISPWHLFMGVMKIFKRTINVFGEETLATDLTLIMRHIAKKIASENSEPDEKVYLEYESIFDTYVNESMAHPLFGSLLLVPLSNGRFQELFWKKCHIIRRFQPGFFPTTISSITSEKLSERAYEYMVQALCARHITKQQTAAIYALAIAHLSIFIFSHGEKEPLKELKREASFECFTDVCAFEAEQMKLDANIPAPEICDVLGFGKTEIPKTRMV